MVGQFYHDYKDDMWVSQNTKWLKTTNRHCIRVFLALAKSYWTEVANEITYVLMWRNVNYRGNFFPISPKKEKEKKREKLVNYTHKIFILFSMLPKSFLAVYTYIVITSYKKWQLINLMVESDKFSHLLAYDVVVRVFLSFQKAPATLKW